MVQKLLFYIFSFYRLLSCSIIYSYCNNVLFKIFLKSIIFYLRVTIFFFFLYALFPICFINFPSLPFLIFHIFSMFFHVFSGCGTRSVFLELRASMCKRLIPKQSECVFALRIRPSIRQCERALESYCGRPSTKRIENVHGNGSDFIR